MDFFQFAGYAEFFVSFSYNNGNPPNRLWICLLVGGLCFLIVYIFQVFGLWTIARREGFGKKWMMLIPFFNTYYIGACSEKNKVYGMKAKHFAVMTAVVEAVLVVFYILYYVAAFQCWDWINWEAQYYPNGQLYGYSYGSTPLSGMPASLNWLWWIFYYGDAYIISWLELVFIILKLLLLTSFFRTYSARYYLVFSIVGALLPLTGILIFAVRNNTGMSYADYIKKVRERNYRMYQQQYGNPYNQNPYSGGQYNAPPEGGQRPSSAPDPFDEYGSSGGTSQGNASGSAGSSSGGSSDGDSPFDEFN